MPSNGTKAKIAVHEEQIKNLFKINEDTNRNINLVNQRFNEEIGDLKDILKGKGEEEGILGKVNYLFEKEKNRDRNNAVWMTIVIGVVLGFYNFILPKLLGG